MTDITKIVPNVVTIQELNERAIKRKAMAIKFKIDVSFTGRGIKEYGSRLQQLIEILQLTFVFPPTSYLNISDSVVKTYKGKVHQAELDIQYQYRIPEISIYYLSKFFSIFFNFFIQELGISSSPLLTYKMEKDTLIICIGRLNRLYDVTAIGSKTKKLSNFLKEDHIIMKITPKSYYRQIEFPEYFLKWAWPNIRGPYTIIEDKDYNINELFESKSK